EQGPFPHAEDAERTLAGVCGLREPFAVVGYLQIHDPARLLQRDLDAVSPRVTGDVGEGLLEDAKQAGGDVRGEGGVRYAGAHPAVDAGAPLEAAGEPLDGGRQPHLVERARPQLAREAADVLDGGVEAAG